MKFKLISIILLLFGGTTGALGLNGGSIIGNISAPTPTISSNKTTTSSPTTSGDKVTETNSQKVVNESNDKVATNGASNTKVNDENNKVTNKVVDVNSSKSEIANKANNENSNQTMNSKTNNNEKEQVTNKVTNVTPSNSETSNKVVSENNNKTTTNVNNKNVANKAQTVNSSNEQNNTLFMAQVEQAIYKQVNEQRVKAGVAPLSYSSTMQQFARYKSEDMGKNHYFSHESPSGQYTIDRIKAAGIPYTAWGENIAYIEGVTNPTELANEFMTNWMNSPGHRANILSPNFTSIGVGVYKAGNTVYATQEFYKQ